MYSLAHALRRAASANPQGAALSCAGRSMTWPQVLERTAGIAATLRSLGVCNGDRVGILAANSDDYFLCLHAIPWAGGIAVPINTRLAEPEMRNWVMERFDHGAIYEHIAFPLILLTGLLLWVLGGWNPASGWFALKLLIIIGIFLPIEIFDYYLAHLGGNKRRLRLKGDLAAYEKGVRNHWLYLVIVSPPIMVFAVLAVFLSVTKPF